MSIERDIIDAISNNERTRNEVKGLIKNTNLTTAQHVRLEDVKKLSLQIEDMLMELLKDVR